MMSHWTGTILGPGHVCTILFSSDSWNVTHFFLVQQTVHENRIYSLKIICGDNYPDESPIVTFLSRVNLPFVNQTTGEVDKSKLPVLAHWNRNNSLETLLVEMRRYAFVHVFSTTILTISCRGCREMASFNNKKLPQPPEGTMF